jgi:inhibitor of KinA sporulation pathway (predicted exonuclease)
MPVLFDTEFTAWAGSMANHWLAPGQFREIVQIGAVKVDAASLATIAKLNLFVRPRFNPVLSDYFVNLTGITNETVKEHGTDFCTAYDRFITFVGDDVMVAFGRDDLVLEDNLQLLGISGVAPMPRHRNIAIWLRENGVRTQGLHACDVAEACGADFKGRKHDAFDDAHSLAVGIRALVERGAANPFTEKR